MIGAACSDVKQEFYEVNRKEKKDKVLEILNDPQRNPSDRCIIFVNQKKQADFLVSNLTELDPNLFPDADLDAFYFDADIRIRINMMRIHNTDKLFKIQFRQIHFFKCQKMLRFGIKDAFKKFVA